jgi:hypothetical protein
MILGLRFSTDWYGFHMDQNVSLWSWAEKYGYATVGWSVEIFCACSKIIKDRYGYTRTATNDCGFNMESHRSVRIATDDAGTNPLLSVRSGLSVSMWPGHNYAMSLSPLSFCLFNTWAMIIICWCVEPLNWIIWIWIELLPGTQGFQFVLVCMCVCLLAFCCCCCC